LLDRARPGTEIKIKKIKSGYKFIAGSFGSISETESREQTKIAGNNNPRKKNLYSGSPRIYSENARERVETFRYKGSYNGYTGSNIYADYQSCVAISPSGRTACVVVGDRLIRRVKAPAGTKFSVDKLGLCVVRLTDKIDFHFLLEILLDKDFRGQIRRELARKYKNSIQARKAAKAALSIQRLFDRQVKSTYVSIEDSRRAGNCIEGSLTFAERRLRLDRDDIIDGRWLYTVPARRLLATGDERASNAVRCAWLRETTISI
jgi:hypothetical protein